MHPPVALKPDKGANTLNGCQLKKCKHLLESHILCILTPFLKQPDKKLPVLIIQNRVGSLQQGGCVERWSYFMGGAPELAVTKLIIYDK